VKALANGFGYEVRKMSTEDREEMKRLGYDVDSVADEPLYDLLHNGDIVNDGCDIECFPLDVAHRCPFLVG
jgi:hypothetical protein